MPLDFELTLTETQSTQEVSLDVKIHRSITLVPGYSYEINCNYKMGGFRGEQNIWFHFNDTPVLVQNTTATLVAVYAIEVDINNWKLVLQQFRETDSGVYTCRGASSSVSLDISYRSGKIKASSNVAIARTFCVVYVLYNAPV